MIPASRILLATFISALLEVVHGAGVPQKNYTSENYFLFEMIPMSDGGRYLNQSERDLEALLPSCPCFPRKPDNCSAHCCYCQLGCPLPEHSFTREVMFQKDATASLPCSGEMVTPEEMKGRPRSRAQLPWLCDRAEYIFGQNSQWFNLICVQGLNLNYFKRFFDLNPGLMGANDWNLHLIDKKYSWRNDKSDSTSSPVAYAESKNNDYTRIDFEELLTRNLDPVRVSKVDKLVAFAFGNINYTQQEDGASQIFRVRHPLEFNISAPTSCSQLSGGRSLEGCNYVVTFPGRNCTQLREAVVIAARIGAYSLTNVTVTQLDARMMEMTDNPGNGSDAECKTIPDNAVITEVRYRTSVVGVFTRLDGFIHNPDLTQFPVRFSYNQVFLSEQHFANLPRFWDEILYGKCLEQYCWRDIRKYGPSDELWRLSNLDKILGKNIFYCFVPLLPILAYFCIHPTLL